MQPFRMEPARHGAGADRALYRACGSAPWQHGSGTSRPAWSSPWPRAPPWPSCFHRHLRPAAAGALLGPAGARHPASGLLRAAPCGVLQPRTLRGTCALLWTAGGGGTAPAAAPPPWPSPSPPLPAAPSLLIPGCGGQALASACKKVQPAAAPPPSSARAGQAWLKCRAPYGHWPDRQSPPAQRPAGFP